MHRRRTPQPSGAAEGEHLKPSGQAAMRPPLPVVLVVDDGAFVADDHARAEDEFEVLTATRQRPRPNASSRANGFIQGILCDQRMPGETGSSWRVREQWLIPSASSPAYTDAEDIIAGTSTVPASTTVPGPQDAGPLLLTPAGAVRARTGCSRRTSAWRWICGPTEHRRSSGVVDVQRHPG